MTLDKEIINEALVKLNSKDPIKALEIINQKSINNTKDPDLLLIAGVSYMMLNNFDEALLHLKKIIKIDPNHKDAYFNIATVYKNKNELKEAIKYLNKVTDLDKNNFKAFSNKCFIKIKLREFENALEDANTSIQINKEYLNAYLQRGNIYKELKFFDKSLNDYNHIIKTATINSDIYYEASYNKSQLLLLTGHIKEGFKLYENRFFISEYNSVKINEPNKEIKSLNNIKDKTILVLGEQGIGDNIQFSRYIKLLREKCSKTLFCVDKNMKYFFEKIKVADIVYSVGDKIDNFDYHLKLMSLPLLFETDKSNIPDINFTIKADVDKSDKWSKLIKKYKSFYKIGINTTANPNIPARRIPIKFFKNICKYKNVKLFNLQKEIDRKEFDINGVEILSFDKFDSSELFEDSKGLIENLDLVISSDTSIAHLSASMDKDTWLILNDVPEWRWLTNDKKSLWYKKITLFRCKKKDDWTEPAKEIENLLKKYN